MEGPEAVKAHLDKLFAIPAVKNYPLSKRAIVSIRTLFEFQFGRILEPQVAEALEVLTEHDIPFEIVTYGPKPSELAAAIKAAQESPETIFIWSRFHFPYKRV